MNRSNTWYSRGFTTVRARPAELTVSELKPSSVGTLQPVTPKLEAGAAAGLVAMYGNFWNASLIVVSPNDGCTKPSKSVGFESSFATFCVGVNGIGSRLLQ